MTVSAVAWSETWPLACRSASRTRVSSGEPGVEQAREQSIQSSWGIRPRSSR
ncbi:hypothetical protein [Nonomuraea dietziae]|uniref:hypothetical protein n=1 Tax=Nonomuraea dietziae TaxID=65515 RepID=UPI0031D52B26